MSNEINENSNMAARLEAVFEKCKKIKGNQIAVPKDVIDRMKILCKNTEKIINDIPNKKFHAAVTLNANRKAVGYYKKVKKGIDKAYDNIKSFSGLKNFYGVYSNDNGNTVRRSVRKYSDSIDECFDKIGMIIEAVNNILEKNEKIKAEALKFGKIKQFKDIESIVVKETDEKDEKLIEFGKIVKDLQGQNLKYTNYVKAFFEYFTEYQVKPYSIFLVNKGEKYQRNGVGLVQMFKDASYSFRRLKIVVAQNEEAISGSGISAERDSIVIKMKSITSELNVFSRKIDESIAFLRDLEIEGSSLNKERSNAVSELNKKKYSYEDKLSKINNHKDSILYGETIIKSKDGNNRYASNKSALAANTVRGLCNGFILNLDGVLGKIKMGKEKAEEILKSAKNLFDEVNRVSKNTVGFITSVNDFKGYFENNDRDKAILNKVQTIYNSINKDFGKMITKIDRSKQMNKIEVLQETLAKEVEDYNKTSSKIKRGAKKVFSAGATMLKYVLYVKSFITSMVGLSNESLILIQKIDNVLGSFDKVDVTIGK